MSSETAAPSIATAKPLAAPASRRGFLLGLGLMLNAVAATLFAVPVLRYILAPGRRLAWLAWIPLGPLTEFPENRTRLASYENPFVRPWDGETAKIPCWVRRMEGESFQVFAVNCTHLGCPVRWFEASGLFMCPCHGGAFYADGRHASGPPPRALYEYEWKIENGRLWVRAGQVPTLGQPEV